MKRKHEEQVNWSVPSDEGAHLLLVEERGISRAQAYKTVSRGGSGGGVAWVTRSHMKHKNMVLKYRQQYSHYVVLKRI